MNGTSRLLIVIAVLGLGLVAPTSGSAAEVACSQRVLTDWSDNGRIDRVYALSCYEDAIASLPTDIRDYTNAQDVIDRAMANAVRARSVVPAADAEASDPQPAGSIDVSGVVPVPLPLVVLFGLALALLAAGAVARVGRRACSAGRSLPGRIHRAWVSPFLRNLQEIRERTVPSGSPPTLPGPLARCSSLHRAGGPDVKDRSGGNDGNGEGRGTQCRSGRGRVGRDREHGRRGGGERRSAPPLHDPRPRPLRGDRVGASPRLHPRQGRSRLRAEGRRVPEVLVADRHQHRRPEVLPRAHVLPGARALRQADDRPHRRHDRRLGPRGRLLRRRRGG